MEAPEFLSNILAPSLAWCAALPAWTPPDNEQSRVMMLSTSGVESAWTERIQAGTGPAAGFWQFERGGGVRGVLTARASAALARTACVTMFVEPDETHAWAVLATPRGDDLACAFARLLLWTDPAPLPAVGDEEGAWEYYLRNWRPGKPGRERWATVYPESLAALKEPTA
jgi:hypothetical protein